MGLANNMENIFVEGEKRLSGHSGRKILEGKKKEKDWKTVHWAKLHSMKFLKVIL